ncbi:hypothetical protein FZEAL_3439 [Fusarium zealandicum]|uniref:Uncharacterized protein n=1 Tax=Fusarium zealandicum TaxID=1053134 RepID=A0A8H4XMY9_9HYPO|nr:hypothetical protein FZEAL_3439 [Fusarium zealandicum]
MFPSSLPSPTQTDPFPLVATVMDAEKGEETTRVSKFGEFKARFPAKKFLLITLFILGLAGVTFGIGVLAAHYVVAENERSHGDMVMVENAASGTEHAVVRRDEAVGASYPISTRTALTTLYGISRTLDVTTEVETVTGTTYVTVPGDEVHVSISVATVESSAEVCEIEVVTMTESYTITVTPTPSEDYSATSAALGDATVTGNPATVTDVETKLSFTSGLPDATVPGNPGTVTNVQTDFSFTSGRPDATVSGNPGTVTDIQTQYSLTTGLPDATVSGNPSTVTDDKIDYSVSSKLPDATVPGNPLTVTEVQQSFSVTSGAHTVITVTNLYSPKEEMSTVTKVTTLERTLTTQKSIVTVTITDLYNQGSATVVSVSPTSTFTQVVFETTGSASTSTKTIQVPAPPYPTANNTMVAGPSGTVTALPTLATPVVISGATKKPEPRGWGGSNGTTNLGCAIMLIATVMFLL